MSVDDLSYSAYSSTLIHAKTVFIIGYIAVEVPTTDPPTSSWPSSINTNKPASCPKVLGWCLNMFIESSFVPSVFGPRHNLPRCIFARCHRLIPLLPLLLPLFRCKTFRGPGVNSRNFGLQCSINQPMSCQCCLLLKLRRYYDCRKCLTTATCNSDQ
jgi:hypothetical protein